MRVIETAVDTASASFAENRGAYEGLVATLAERMRWAIDGGPGRDRSIERHLARGKVMARDRIDMVIDEDTSFLELSTLAGYGQYDDEVPGAGIVTGIGLVHGVPYVFIANDATVKGGSLVPVAIKKHVRAQDIAEQNGLGVIYLVDSGGAFLPLQDEIFPDKDHFGGSFYRQARMSAQGLPQLSVVLGGCTAGGAYVPALSDEVIMVEGIGRIFLGGPPIVKAALGEIIEPDDLGGAGLHTRVSGVSDYLASTEEEAYGRLREICETTSQRRIDQRQGWLDWIEPEPPVHDPAEIYGIVSADDRIPFDATEIIARIADGSRFSAFKPEWGASIVTGFARIWGHLVGHRRQQRDHLHGVGAEGDALHRVVRAATHPARVPPEHVGIHGRAGLGGRRHRQARRQDGQCGRQRHSPEVHRAHRRLVRSRQLWDVRARVQPSLPVRMAELSHRHDVCTDCPDGARRHPPGRDEGRGHH
jgi:3-methylcrotonyl-CoA carboxylase beta subunit